MARTEAFNAHHEQYEQWFEENRYVYQSELEAVRHFLPSRGEGLEIGVGSGRFAAPLGIRFGVEPSEAMRKLARSRGIEVYDGVAESLPFDDERFDFTLMVTTICFVDDLNLSFREAFRVLKQGGAFIVGFVDSASALGKTYQRHKAQNVFYSRATFYSTQEMLDRLKACGFENPAMVQTVFGALPEIRSVQKHRSGYGRGGFVVVRAWKSPRPQ